MKLRSVLSVGKDLTTLDTAMQSVSEKRGTLLPAILLGGGVAGVLDMIPAFITFGITAPQGVAAGLIGRSAAFQGGHRDVDSRNAAALLYCLHGCRDLLH